MRGEVVGGVVGGVVGVKIMQILDKKAAMEGRGSARRAEERGGG